LAFVPAPLFIFFFFKRPFDTRPFASGLLSTNACTALLIFTEEGEV
jgi:hypothetical protein